MLAVRVVTAPRATFVVTGSLTQGGVEASVVAEHVEGNAFTTNV
jgi:hypothetical protein